MYTLGIAHWVNMSKICSTVPARGNIKMKRIWTHLLLEHKWICVHCAQVMVWGWDLIIWDHGTTSSYERVCMWEANAFTVEADAFYFDVASGRYCTLCQHVQSCWSVDLVYGYITCNSLRNNTLFVCMCAWLYITVLQY